MVNFKKYLFVIAGSLSLVLGIIGLFLPLLPTTPFLLLTAYLYAKSSDRMYQWLLKNRVFGKFLSRYKQRLGIPLKTKIVGLATLWASIIFTSFYVLQNWFPRIALITIAIAVTVHLLHFPTYHKNKRE
ncbi:MAG: uncharacterized protein QG635_1413 [Bacteroidota bacterium]|nr:uncharacterized protein [Bacteroidota bacterium]